MFVQYLQVVKYECEFEIHCFYLFLCIAEAIYRRLLSFSYQNQIYKSIVIHFWNIKTK